MGLIINALFERAKIEPLYLSPRLYWDIVVNPWPSNETGLATLLEESSDSARNGKLDTTPGAARLLLKELELSEAQPTLPAPASAANIIHRS